VGLAAFRTSSNKQGDSGAGASVGRRYVGLFFTLPAIIFTLVFFILPLGMTIFMSLHKWSLMGEHNFIGIQNYIDLLTRDSQFWNSLWFTTRYTLLITPAIFIIAFLLALLVNLPLRMIGVFRTIYFLPAVIGLVRIIRERHPETPITLISPIAYPPNETAPNVVNVTMGSMRADVESAFTRLVDAGDAHLRYVNGLALFDEALLAQYADDQCHPGPDGQQVMAERFMRLVLSL